MGMKQAISFVIVTSGLSAAMVVPGASQQASGHTPFPAELIHFDPSGGFHASGISPNLRRSFAYDGGGEAVLSRWGERDSQDPDKWHVSEVLETVSFKTTAVAAREGGDQLFVAGIRSDGVDLIERWIYSPRPGGYRIASASGPAQSVGSAMPPYSGQEVLEGSVFVPPPSRQHDPARRTPLLTGAAVGHVRSMVADPEGRFLLTLSYPSGNVYRVSLTTIPATTELLFTPGTIPHLSSVKTMTLRHHVDQGRKVVLSDAQGSPTPDGHQLTILNDADNDGIFESFATSSPEQWAAAGYDEDDCWVSYFNLGVAFDW